ncbi:MAG: group III truncated hemoglobin [Pseudomonadota bacterium]
MMSETSKGRTVTIDPALLSVRAARPARPVHEDISEERISDLVESFYAAIRSHERLGPLFEEKVAGDWAPHLARMKMFWRSVLLKTGEYHGQPVPKHLAILQLESDDFRLWLDLFRQHAHERFDAEAADLIVQAAERIAQSLWLAKFGTPDNSVPAWMKSRDTARTGEIETEC